jgi:hypothetical protein
VAVEGGWSRPRWALGVEWAQPFRRVNITSRLDYIFSPSITVSRYRESTLLGITRFPLPGTGVVQAALVGGVGVVRGSSLQRISQGRFGSGAFGPFGPEQEVVAHAIATMLGGEMLIGVTRHVAVLPQMRLLIIPRGSVVEGGAFPQFGFNSVLYRGGVGIRITL